jgi:hypothetical protein
VSSRHDGRNWDEDDSESVLRESNNL